MKLVALQDDSLKNRKFLRCESKMTDSHCGQGNKAHDAGGTPRHMAGAMALLYEEDVLFTSSPIKGVLLQLVSRGTR